MDILWGAHCVVFLLLFLVQAAPAQRSSLTGFAVVQNSKYNTGAFQYLKDAFIGADFASPTSTDENGKWQLTFEGLPKGLDVSISAEKAGFVVANHKEIEKVSLKRKMPIYIHFAKPQQLLNAQIELYNISLSSLTKRYDETITRLNQGKLEQEKAIDELEQKINRSISSREEAVQLLESRLESLKKQLPAMASLLSEINLDFASKLYIRAFELFRNGEIEECIRILEKAELDQIAVDLLNRLDSIDLHLDHLKEAIDSESTRAEYLLKTAQLKASSLSAQGYFQAALEILLNIEVILKEHQKYERLLPSLLWDIGELYQALDWDIESISYKQAYVEQLMVKNSSFALNERTRLSEYLKLLHRNMQWLQLGDFIIEYSQMGSQLGSTFFKEVSIEPKEVFLLCAERKTLKNEYSDAMNYLNYALKYPLSKLERRIIKKKIKKLRRYL